jgi:hypothetical protein
VTGDAKVVWEPNRHHHLVVLGRAYRAFGDPRYAAAALRQIASWIDDNPFGYGMNWRSPLELGIRVINWVWALDLARDMVDRPRGIDERVRETVWRHLREIAGKYSRGSSANNHLIGEAAGVFIGAAYFPDFPEASAWKEESREILSREILRQTYPTAAPGSRRSGITCSPCSSSSSPGSSGGRSGPISPRPIGRGSRHARIRGGAFRGRGAAAVRRLRRRVRPRPRRGGERRT